MPATNFISSAAHTAAPSRLSERSSSAASPDLSVDTSNLSPGAAARFEKLMRSIDDFAAAVQNKAITLPDRMQP